MRGVTVVVALPGLTLDLPVRLHNISQCLEKAPTKVLILVEGAYMSQMLYAGQSGREIVTFLSDF